MNARLLPRASANLASWVIYGVIALTCVTLLYPPFTSVNGTEHAFVLTGPEWSHRMGPVGRDLGLTARIHWPALLLQLAVLWTLALATRSAFGRRRHRIA